jgi:hypothetical protein
MPFYNLCCEDCDQKIEIFCSISEYDKRISKTVCPTCSSKNIYRDYQSDNIYSTVKEIKTVGQLADANAKKYKSILNEADAKKQEETKVEKPWYQKNAQATSKEINKMTKKQKQKYIMEGKK